MLIKYVWTEEFNDNLKRLNQHGGINKKVVDRNDASCRLP